MIRAGICTISFRPRPVDEALEICAQAGATGVELWGWEHFPPDGAAEEARRQRALAESLGLSIPVYGAYAYAGEEDWPVARMRTMLDRVLDLGASRVRVWAGKKGSAEATPEDWTRIVDDLKAWGDEAAKRDLLLVVERHCSTVTDFGACARQLIERVDHPAVRLNYQAPYPCPTETINEDLQADLPIHLPLSAHMHVQNFRIVDGEYVREPLTDGLIDFAAWLPHIEAAAFDGWAMLEFLPEAASEELITVAERELASLRKLFKLPEPERV